MLEGIQIATGIAQSIFGGKKARKAQKQLEGMVEGYQPSPSIQDYYNKALQRYSVNPYTSSLYNYQQGQIKAGTAQGIQALQDRRSALAGIPQLIQAQNDALLKAGATAEGQQAQALGQLGQAAGMKTAEDRYKFENKYNLLAQKAGAAAQTSNMGLQNIFQGIGGIERNIQSALGMMVGGTGGIGSTGSSLMGGRSSSPTSFSQLQGNINIDPRLIGASQRNPFGG